ncbi:MAG: hypothetical protein ACD_67C00030G0001 [uncultured bacterium]|nr:MAG: hypothetical protein ACD_67C00030G0001 [uncultured bacterium]
MKKEHRSIDEKKLKNAHSAMGGFSLVEVLLTIALFAIFVTVFSGSLVYGQESERLAGDRIRANFLAEEGLEAVRNMRDGNFSNLTIGTHGLVIQDGKWNFSGTSDTTGIFTREIIITESGTSEKAVTVNVAWKQNEQRSGLVSLESRFDDWKIANPTEAEQILVVTNNSQIASGGSFQVTDVTVENVGIEDVKIANMQTSWSGVFSGAKLIGINMGGNSVWTGSDSTGSVQDITDFTVTLGAGAYPMAFVFDKTVNGISLNVLFTMTDGSVKEVIFIPGSPTDETPPANINDLSASAPTTTTLNLSWTAPGDDGSTGTATAYDIRYSTAPITSGNWSSAIQASGEPTPSVAGTSQNMTIAGLSLGTTYYFAMKTSDEVPNVSAISNVASGTTNALPQANYLLVNTTNVALSANKRDVIGITLQNSGPTNISIASIGVSWSGIPASRRLVFIQINGANSWSGAVASGVTNDVNPDIILSVGSPAIPVNYLRFNNTVSNIILSLTFNMSDGSTKTVSGIGPLL